MQRDVSNYLNRKKRHAEMCLITLMGKRDMQRDVSNYLNGKKGHAERCV